MPKLYVKLVQSKAQREAMNAEGLSISAIIIPQLGRASFKSRNSVSLTQELRDLVGQEFLADVNDRLVTYTRGNGDKVTEYQLQVTPMFTGSKMLQEGATARLAEACDWECNVMFPSAQGQAPFAPVEPVEPAKK